MMDADFVDTIKGMIVAGSQTAVQSGQTLNQSVIAGWDTVAKAVVQAQASNSDDPAVIAALQTASRAPQGEKTT